MTERSSVKHGENEITGISVVFDPEATGRKIRRLIKESPYTIEDIAYFSMCSPQAVYKWLCGETMPRIENIITLAEVLETDAENLLVCRVEITRRDGSTDVREER